VTSPRCVNAVSAAPAPATKAVILARGLGTRMRKQDTEAGLSPDQTAMADSGIKGMVDVGRPFLDFVLSALADAAFEKVCLVIGPEHDVVRHYYKKGEGKPTRLTLELAVQEEPLGTANAVIAAEAFAGSDPFVVLNSDNYYPPAALSLIGAAPGPAIAGFRRSVLVAQSNIHPDRASRFGALEADDNGFLVRILVGQAAAEKPDSEALASMNCWLFDQSVFEACRRVPLSVRGEFELPQAVQLAIDRREMKVRVVPIDAAVLDLSSRGDVATVATLLEGIEVRT
jgi:dTDP-glucose pyrophosphorylase